MRALVTDAVDEFERFRRSQDIAKGTLKQQRGILTRFITVNGNVYCDKINETHVTRHMEDAAKTKQPQSMRNDHQALAVFFSWCRHTKRMPPDSNPLYGRRLPQNSQRERERVHVSKFPALIEAAGQRCSRDRALVSVILYTLLRDREVADLRVRDVDLEGGWLSARISKKKRVFEDRLPISQELDEELRLWLTHYTEQVGGLHPNYYLIPSRATRPILGPNGRIVANANAFLKPQSQFTQTAKILRPLLESVGFPVVGRDGNLSYEGAHTLRRSGARALFDRLVHDSHDGALRVVQAQLHHASMTETERYIGITADRRTRDEIIRGQRMYGLPPVTSISSAKSAQAVT